MDIWLLYQKIFSLTNSEVKTKIIEQIKTILLSNFPNYTKDKIESMAEFIYKVSVGLVYKYIDLKQKQKL